MSSNAQTSVDTEVQPSPKETTQEETEVSPSEEKLPNPSVSQSAPTAKPKPLPSQDFVNNEIAVLTFDDGTIIGGYSNGIWLTHLKAANLCNKKMTFYKYAMMGYLGKTVSSGVEISKVEGYYSGSYTNKEKDEGIDCRLKTKLNTDDWEYYTLLSVDPRNLQAADVVSDNSAILPEIQKLADKKAGAGNATVNIPIAVSADIDGDGEQEIVINADNGASIEAEFEEGKKWYSIACVMESDGSMHVIEENYSDPSDFGVHVFLQNVFDMNNDGKYELVVVNRSYESFGATVYQYDGKKFSDVLSYSNGV
jgi:hypothetical protein